MKKKLLIIVVCVLVILASIIWLIARFYLRLEASPLVAGVPIYLQYSENVSAAASPVAVEPVPYAVETVVEGLVVPWSLVFTTPERILITERPGRVRVVENGVLQSAPLRTFPEVSSDSEEGLMGMTLDPNYAENKFVYLCVAYEKNGQTIDKVVRVTDTGAALVDDFIVIDDIPAARFHAGCRVRFGPDSLLYISTGDATKKESAQDTSSLAGKMLRIQADGGIPVDNPISNSPIYSLGHRNPQGFDWHPLTNTLVVSEHGPSGNDGPGGGDEINVIEKGGNYGWPVVSHEKSQSGFISPVLLFTPAVAPASGMFYRNSVFPQLTNTFLFGALRGEGIIQVIFDPNDGNRVLSYQKLAGIEAGRVRDIVEGPDGTIYFTTSNADGRGKLRVGDDKLFRLVAE